MVSKDYVHQFSFFFKKFRKEENLNHNDEITNKLLSGQTYIVFDDLHHAILIQ